MALTIPQQIQQLIKTKRNILITFRKDWNGDSLGSAVALWLFLHRQGKSADVVCEGFTLPKTYRFLGGADKVRSMIAHLQKFILTIDVKTTGVEELSYDLKDEKLHVFITPKTGFLTRDHVRTAQTDFKYDLIFVLDTQDLASLGGLYDNNTELFYKTPIVNLDYHPGNEHFGQINVTDLTVASTAEILFDLLQKLGSEFIDTPIATALLTGIIATTRSFKSDNVKPHTLTTASKLMALGAERERIVINLFQTRSIGTLKLWGYALTHIQNDHERGLVWTTITRDDFVRSGATEHDVKEMIDELIVNSPEAKLTLILHEHPDTAHTVHGVLRSHTKEHDALQLLQPFRPTGSKQEANFTLTDRPLKTLEEGVVKHLQQTIQSSL